MIRSKTSVKMYLEPKWLRCQSARRYAVVAKAARLRPKKLKTATKLATQFQFWGNASDLRRRKIGRRSWLNVKS